MYWVAQGRDHPGTLLPTENTKEGDIESEREVEKLTRTDCKLEEGSLILVLDMYKHKAIEE